MFDSLMSPELGTVTYYGAMSRRGMGIADGWRLTAYGLGRTRYQKHKGAVRRERTSLLADSYIVESLN